MLESLRGQASDRKLRLFGVACCRRIWHLLPRGPGPYEFNQAAEVAQRLADGLAGRQTLDADAPSFMGPDAYEFNHYAVEVAERYADGLAGRQTLDDAIPLFTRYCIRNEVDIFGGDSAFKTWQVILPDAFAAAFFAAFEPGSAVGGNAVGRERQVQAALLRDVFGNPFRPAPVVDPAWLAWEGGIVVRLAQALYEERHPECGALDNARLAVLADALEEAGCTSEDLLAHCRGGGEHVRGCWAVDLVLGRS
jgi:hypothetical protein